MIWFRRGLVLAAFIILLYLFWPLLAEMGRAADLFRQATWAWLAAAALIQLVSYASLTALNHLLLRPFEGRISFGRLMAILPATACVEVALPSAGLSGVVLRARYLARRGYSAEASTFTLALETIYLAAAMAAASVIGLWHLVRAGGFSFGQSLILAGAAFGIVAAGAGIFSVGRDRARAQQAAAWLLTRWNRLAPHLGLRPQPLAGVQARAQSFYDGVARLGRTPRWPYLLAASGRVALDVGSLGACFAAFRYLISPGVLLTGYGLTLLLSGLAALPGGLGLADVSLAVIYARLGAPGAVALAASLSYRLIAFWLLRLAGLVTWQALEVAT